ncbi:AEC family transporter [Limnobacter litoralis]|uniref:AEC family transporter n=1 Tax=Limnobacter litoralis TaxID=481366 RepID=A0ABQ5YUS2_9BURK|nr:AEC family transporter [Limnobacter litoralis]GLR27202.1 hypothetical protein GCM10007875_22930 [Limnobacter litoralis]
MSPLILFPDFAVIALGFALRRFWLPASAWATIEKLVYFVLFPCLLFYSIVHSEIELGKAGVFGAGSAFVVLAATLLGAVAKPLSHMNRVDFASGLQTAYRFNSYIALALASRIDGAQGVAHIAILMAIAVPLCNVIAVGSMSKGKYHQIPLEILKNPLVISTLLGIGAKLLHLPVPAPVMETLSRLGQAAVALGLMAVGAGLLFSGLRGHWLISVWWLTLKLLVSPILALGYAHWAHLTIDETRMLVIFAALPSASSAYILAARMGGNAPLVACLISLSTVGAAFSLPLVFLLPIH